MKKKLLIISLANGEDHQRYVKIVANKMSENYNIMLITTLFFDREGLKESIYVLDCFTTLKTRVNLKSFNPLLFIKLYKIIKIFNPSIVHFFSVHPLNLFIYFICYKKKCIFTLHDVIPHPGEKINIFIKMYNYIIKIIAYKIVVHSKYAQKCLESFKSKSVVLPLCGSLKKNRDYIKGNFIMFFGRIRSYKGLDIFIKAAEEAISYSPKMKFVIAGSGEMDLYLELIKHKENFLVFNKYISVIESDFLFQSCKFLVLPYYSATQSGVVPLAFSYGKPVIVTNVGALPEMVEDNCGLVVNVSINEIAKSMVELWENKEKYDRMCRKVRYKYQKTYSKEYMENEFENFYNRFLYKRGSLK